MRNLRLIIDEVRPDMIWQVGILVPGTKWPCSLICEKRGIPYLVSPRGEVCDSTFRTKYLKKKTVSIIAKAIGIYKDAYFHATDEEERAGLIKYYSVRSERIFVVPNIPSSLKAECRCIAKNPGELKIVFISRIQEKKNLLLAIESAMILSGRIQFDIYGPIESFAYWEKCDRLASRAPGNVSIRYCGPLLREEVSRVFGQYHCFLFPTSSENYGHVISESLAASCPVVLSRGTTPWDDLDCVAGKVCAMNSEDMAAGLSDLARMGQEEYDELRRSTAAYYSKKVDEDGAVEGHLKMLEIITS